MYVQRNILGISRYFIWEISEWDDRGDISELLNGVQNTKIILKPAFLSSYKVSFIFVQF